MGRRHRNDSPIVSYRTMIFRAGKAFKSTAINQRFHPGQVGFIQWSCGLRATSPPRPIHSIVRLQRYDRAGKSATCVSAGRRVSRLRRGRADAGEQGMKSAG